VSDEPLGRFIIPVSAIERRLDNKPVVSRWFGLNCAGPVQSVLFVVTYIVFVAAPELILPTSTAGPVQSVLFVVTYIVFVAAPELILPTGLVMVATVGLWRYRLRPGYPAHMDTRLSARGYGVCR